MRLSTSFVKVIFCLFLSTPASFNAISFASSKEINFASSLIFSESGAFVSFTGFESSVIFTAPESCANAVIDISESSIAIQSKIEIGLIVLRFITHDPLFHFSRFFRSFLFMPEREYPALFSFMGCTLLSGMRSFYYALGAGTKKGGLDFKML